MGTTKEYYSQITTAENIITDLILSKSIKTVFFLVRWLTAKNKKEFYITLMVNASKENSKMTKSIMVYKLIKKNCILEHLKKG
jgi:hypothetical protein